MATVRKKKVASKSTGGARSAASARPKAGGGAKKTAKAKASARPKAGGGAKKTAKAKARAKTIKKPKLKMFKDGKPYVGPEMTASCPGDCKSLIVVTNQDVVPRFLHISL
jgi:hypothetical protein